MAIFLFTKMLAPNVWAFFADRVAAKYGSSLGLMKFATLATLIIYSFLYVSDGFWQVAVAMVGYCFFWNASLPQLEAATLNHLSDKRRYGRVRLWGSLGFIVTASALGFVMDQSSPGAVLHAGSLTLMVLFFASFLMRDRASGNPNGSSVLISSSTLSSPVISADSDENKSQQAEKRASFISELLTINVIVVLVFCLLMQLSHAPMQAFLSIYLSDYGYTNFEIGLLWTTGVIFEIVIFIYAYQLLKRYSLSSLLSFTFLVAALRWGLIGLFPDISVVVFLTQVMHAITFGLYHAVMMQLIDRMFTGPYQIRGQALYSSVSFGLGGAIGSFVSGYIWTELGKQELFVLSGMLMVLVCAFSLAFSSHLIKE